MFMTTEPHRNPRLFTSRINRIITIVLAQTFQKTATSPQWHIYITKLVAKNTLLRFKLVLLLGVWN
jgi:hypothetical protein